METIIGRIVEVKGLIVRAKLFKLLPPFLVKNGSKHTAPKINGFVKTRVGLDSVICQVVGEYNEEKEDQPSTYYLNLQVKGYISKESFVQGLRVLPIVSSNVELLTEDDYGIIYNNNSSEPLMLGKDLFDESHEISADVNMLMPSHIGVFGNTGSGKSNTLTKIYKEYYSVLEKHKTQAGKFIVFDLNNEYGEDAITKKENKVIYKLNLRGNKGAKIPFDIQKLDEDDFVLMLNASPKIQAPIVKNAFKHTKNDSNFDYVGYVRSLISNNQKHLFYNFRDKLKGYVRGLDNFRVNSKTGDFYYKLDDGHCIYSSEKEFENYLNKISIDKPEDTLEKMRFELYFSAAQSAFDGVLSEYMMPLLNRAEKLLKELSKVFDSNSSLSKLFDGKRICIIQLGLVNKDLRELIPSLLSNSIFKIMAEYKEDKNIIKQIINIVVDEAHNLLYEDNEEVHQHYLQIFEKIVKEGRKFGVFLTLASQRPSDISATIISQLHNYFIHKLVNPSDIQKIRKAVAYMDDEALDFMTVLAPGECIISGTAFVMPTFVYVNQVDSNSRPLSGNVDLIGDKGIFKNNGEEFRF